MKSPSAMSRIEEIIPQSSSGTASLIISAKPTARQRKRVPTELIMRVERKGILIPALPIPTAAAKLSVQTAVISRMIFIIADNTAPLIVRYYSL